MATVSAQASAPMFQPCVSRSRFLTGSSGRLNRDLFIKPMAFSSSTTTSSLKIEAKKGEWLPGLASPGRLAMLAFLGFVVQHNITGKGPFDNLLQHVADPWHNTIIQTLSGN
ncbi:hypothetical protein HS088_TW16G00581 [Tripterygium wilfordii]|uniref:Chlorophyll a-b binding protein, chloroplastic n=1 Tax=Tripterygium wilfordii TaxID=458696 RepID=A0A7J7CJ94_TRIWF|nr:hypothetical protein HS088_TW16G00581 [Tripterygium wilfordii]